DLTIYHPDTIYLSQQEAFEENQQLMEAEK
ncbi:hypothetical protein IGK56_002863, partial [Enterococcus sp. AZ152]